MGSDQCARVRDRCDLQRRGHVGRHCAPGLCGHRRPSAARRPSRGALDLSLTSGGSIRELLANDVTVESLLDAIVLDSEAQIVLPVDVSPALEALLGIGDDALITIGSTDLFDAANYEIAYHGLDDLLAFDLDTEDWIALLAAAAGFLSSSPTESVLSIGVPSVDDAIADVLGVASDLADAALAFAGDPRQLAGRSRG